MQEAHVESLTACFRARQVALDTSVLGAGKTYTSSFLGAKLGLDILVVCPATLVSKWEGMRDEGVPVNKVVSYAALASKKPSKTAAEAHRPRLLPHKMLLRSDIPDENDVVRTTFEPSPWLADRIGRGVLLIVDESQAVKNNSAQSAAVGAFIRMALLPSNPSRVLLMSGSPLDKSEQWVSYLRVLGIIESPLSQSDVRSGTVATPGLEEFVERAPEVLGISRERLTPPPEVLGVARKAECERWLYTNFVEEILPVIGSAMTPDGLSSGKFVRDVFYEHAAEDSRQVRNAMRALRRAERELQDKSADGLGALTLAMQKLEMAKVNTFAREAVRIVRENPRAHVVLGMNYVDSISDVHGILEKDLAGETVEVALIWGKTTQQQRSLLTARFQDPDDPLRVLVCNTRVISTGIDLDDKVGDCPRTALISPTYHTIDMYQVTRRFYRADSKSEPTVNIVYIAQDGTEENMAETNPERAVLQSVEGKGGVMKEVCRQQAEAGVLFPSDHTRVVCDVQGETKVLPTHPAPAGSSKRGREATEEAGDEESSKRVCAVEA